MSKKKFGSLDSVFETSKVSASMVVKKYQSNSQITKKVQILKQNQCFIY